MNGYLNTKMANSKKVVTKPRILIIGNQGQVGWELQRTMTTLGEVVAIGRQTKPIAIDLENPDTIRKAVREINPDWIINAAAYTLVDKAEEEPDLAMVVNGIAPGILAEEAKALGVPMIHYSTDYVFDGNATEPYLEGSPANPLSVYGKTKLAGDKAIEAIDGQYLIFRTGWVYGYRGHNFLMTIKRLAMAKNELSVVDDQVGSPTWCRHIAEITADIVTYQIEKPARPMQDIYNLTAGGQASWYEFANAIVDLLGKSKNIKVTNIRPLQTDEYPLPAPRPAYSVLDNSKLSTSYDLAIPSWTVGLIDAMDTKNTALP